MELTIRDWMVIIGAGLILAVLLDAARRVYRERRNEVRLNTRVSRRNQGEDEDDEFNLLSELPNGGARIVQRDDLAAPSDYPEEVVGPQPVVVRADTDTRESAPPSDIDPVETSDIREDADEGFVPPSFSALDDEFDTHPSAEAPASVPADDTPETLDWLDQLDRPVPEQEPEARLPRDMDPHVFVLNVVARQEAGFAGGDILQILLGCDLRFGDMDFFHRHEQQAGRGPIQFSVANMMKPGVFDIDRMDELHTRGLMFFVTLPGPEDMLKAFDYMYETAKTVARNLDGDVLDETRSAVTRQSLEHTRQQIRELERRLAMEQNR